MNIGQRPMQFELEAAERFTASARRVIEQLAPAPTRLRLALSLRNLAERLVSELLPVLAAEEAVLHEYLDPKLYGDLKATGKMLRALIERLEIVTESAERSHSRGADVGLASGVLRETVTTLAALVDQQRAAYRQLRASLSPADQKLLAEALEAAATVARAQTMLIVQPTTPSRASTVLRKRPDLEVAYPVSLAAFERSAAANATEIRARMDTSPTPHGGRP